LRSGCGKLTNSLFLDHLTEEREMRVIEAREEKYEGKGRINIVPDQVWGGEINAPSILLFTEQVTSPRFLGNMYRSLFTV